MPLKAFTYLEADMNFISCTRREHPLDLSVPYTLPRVPFSFFFSHYSLSLSSLTHPMASLKIYLYIYIYIYISLYISVCQWLVTLFRLRNSFEGFPGCAEVKNRLPMQGTRVRALVREDPTCCGATKPVHHNY